MIIPQDSSILFSGSILLILGSVLMYFKQVPAKIYAIFERYFIIKLEIRENDEAFLWMKLWLSTILSKNLSVTVLTQTNSDENIDILRGGECNCESCLKEAGITSSKKKILFVPSPSSYFFRYKGKKVWLNYNRQSNEGKSNTLTLPTEDFAIRILSRDISIARSMVEEARDFANPKDNRIQLRASRYGSWLLNSRIDKRDISSIILPPGIKENILEDIKKFKTRKHWYNSLGIPYRRGYLLYGPPGCGKTTLALSIASELNMDLNVLNLSAASIDDDTFSQLLSKVDVNTIIAIEDIDCVLTKRDTDNNIETTNVSPQGVIYAQPESKAKNALTMSGLLNGLDGLSSSESRIILMTTNYINKLDSALIRPGRVDYRVEFKNATKDQIKRLFCRFYPATKSDVADVFVANIEDYKYSMAQLQGYFMVNETPDLALINFAAFALKDIK